ncbi:MAG: efflux RND transporter permease subunit [Steroidobacteraceae bacterium]
MVNFFIDRPIFAWVIAICLMLAGTLAITLLPVEQYPDIAPPSVQIRATYSGASAQTVEDTVTQVIEQQMNGIDHLLYMSSTSDDSGTATISLTFDAGTNPDIAQVQVQNKLQLATPLLPAPVQLAGVSVTKSSASFLMVAGFVSTDNRMNRYDLANYLASNVQDPISRVNGVGTVTVFGTEYAMRIWLDPDKLSAVGLTPVDVATALQGQNVQIAAGQLGGTPAVPGQGLTATIREATLLRTPQQFGNVLLKVNPDGSQVRIKDVARVELGGENYTIDTKYNGQPAAGLAVQLASGANALQTANAVRTRLAQLSRYFPHGLKVVYPYDTTPFVRLSIRDVVETLFEGVVLVFLVMYLFLQNIRATLIPTVAVPVVLLGTFATMYLVGFSINTLSMFGLVLAIGLLVDDAIVVVENVERVIAEEGLSPRAATRQAMSQITGALVGVALVLSAVFVPMAFFGGSVGEIYRQFSLTIVVAMILSVIVALIITPALCATMLKAIPKGQHHDKRGFFGWFNRMFHRGREQYQSGVRSVIRRSGRWLILYALMIAVAAVLFLRMPTAFLPQEDQGMMQVEVTTPPGSTMQRTQQVLDEVSTYLHTHETADVAATFEIAGFNFAGRGQNAGLVFVRLKPWDMRRPARDKVFALMSRINAHFRNYRYAIINTNNPPAIPRLGNASGFDLELEDRGGQGHAALVQARNRLIALASNDPILSQVHANGQEDEPIYSVQVDREKASALGVPLPAIDQTFSIAWGSLYVNNFLDTDNRIKRVYVQADAPFRMNPSDVDLWYVRNLRGEMVPFSSFATGKWGYGSPRLERYNGVASMEIQGAAATGRSTGEAMNEMQRLISMLPSGVGYDWSGISYQEKLSGAQAPRLYGISILVVFLSLAALYESWSIPFSVIMVVPIGILGALMATMGRGLSNDVYFQVGLLTTVGLSAKNAILIVEFAEGLQARGRSAIDAAMEAARLRLRPILMTSLAFILGVLPLALSNGAGSGSQHAIGTAVIGGMITATFLATFLIPMFFVVVREKFSGKAAADAARPVDADPEVEGHRP